MRIILLAALASSCSIGACSPENCRPLSGDPMQGGATVRANIYEPGKYCLSEDLHSRVGVPGAHRYSEVAMIEIWASDVELDLKGHTLGRGVVFRDRGKGAGVLIADDNLRPYDAPSTLRRTGRLRNIVIKNGVLRDFKVGVQRIAYPFGAKNILDRPSGNLLEEERFVVEPERKTGVVYFKEDNIRLENLRFENVEKDVELTDIRLVPMPTQPSTSQPSK